MTDTPRNAGDMHPILVMGMHRSGTSCLTGVLKACGASLGPEDQMIPPKSDNPLGFFENERLVRICALLLFSADADWWKVSRFDISALPPCTVNEARSGFSKLLDELGPESVVALKDPRLCLLLPVFKPLLPRVVYVHVVRSPAEVALSLNARNGIGLAEAIALWEVYNRSAIQATAGERRLLVDYRDLVNRPEQTVSELLAGLDSFGVVNLQMPGTGALAKLVRDDLYHQRDDGTLLDAVLTEDQKAFWHSLKSLRWPECTGEDASRRYRSRLLASLERQMEMQQEETARLAPLGSRLAERDAAVAELTDKLEAETTRARTLEERVAANDLAIREIRDSRVWRMTAPLRAAAAGIALLAQSVRRAAGQTGETVLESEARADKPIACTEKQR